MIQQGEYVTYPRHKSMTCLFLYLFSPSKVFKNRNETLLNSWQKHSVNLTLGRTRKNEEKSRFKSKTRRNTLLGTQTLNRGMIRSNNAIKAVHYLVTTSQVDYVGTKLMEFFFFFSQLNIDWSCLAIYCLSVLCNLLLMNLSFFWEIWRE